MQDIIDNIVADYTDTARVAKRDNKISRSILDRLAATNVGEVEKLFRCFAFHERIESPERAIWTYIPVATLNIPLTAEKKEHARVRVDAWIFLNKDQDGKTTVQGEYRANY